MTTTNCPYNPFDREVLDDPFPAYREARGSCPVHHFTEQEPGFYTAFRYDDVVAVVSNPDEWTATYGLSPRFQRGVGFNNEGSEHRKFRKATVDSLTPRNLKVVEPEIRQLVDELLGNMAATTSGDFHEMFAAPLPIGVIARLMGITGDLGHFKKLSDALMEEGMNNADSDGAGFRRVLAELNSYWAEQLAPRRALLSEVDDPNPSHLGAELPDDIMSRLLLFRNDDGEALSEFEINNTLMNMLLAGNETTTSLLTNLVWRLLEDRSRWETVQDDRSLLPNAIEESLRFDAPVLGMFRTSLTETELGGVGIPAKTKIMATYGSANRDPEKFSEPDEFRLDRPRGEVLQHMAFGRGPHACPGAPLTRLEVTIAMNGLLDRFPDLRLDGFSERITPFNFWGRRYLPLAW
ncbi:cytochrome P450 [Gordonia mangrovi]|nr:cytochrome P450 [Gordonia mangrovi]UVF76585.1 cytochrome P450 [Gordonia mangrovi]